MIADTTPRHIQLPSIRQLTWVRSRRRFQVLPLQTLKKPTTCVVNFSCLHTSNCHFQVDEEEEETPDPKKVVDEDDVSQDSLIKAPKRGGGDTKGKGKAAGKAKAR